MNRGRDGCAMFSATDSRERERNFSVGLHDVKAIGGYISDL